MKEEVDQLRKENQELREALEQALSQLNQTPGQLGVALKRIAELEKLKTPTPAFAKANKKKQQAEEKKERKKREAQHNRARPR